MKLSKEEIQFMQGILLNNGKLTENESLSLEQTSWLNRYVDLGFWKYGLKIQAGWLTDDGKEYFIEVLWESEMPQGASTRFEMRIAHLTRVLEFAKEKLKMHRDNLSLGMIERMESEWPGSVVVERESGTSVTAS